MYLAEKRIGKENGYGGGHEGPAKKETELSLTSTRLERAIAKW